MRIIAACSCIWALQFHYGLSAMNRGQGWVDLILTASMFLLLSKCASADEDRTASRHSAILGAVFTLLLAIGGGWADKMRYGQFTSVPVYLLYYANGFVGTFIVLYSCIRFLLHHAKDMILLKENMNSVRWFWKTFLVCALVWTVFLLNQYPGSMESDHMRQLLHLLEGKLDNRNPLISSLLVFGCFQIARIMGLSPNAGIFLYSIFQILLLASAFAYGVSLFAREGAPRKILIVLCLFCALVPYNVFYSYGMWKDTLFAVFLLYTVFASADLWFLSSREARIPWFRYFIVAVFALLCGLSRNSGLFSLIVMIPAVLVFLRERGVKKGLCISLSSGLAVSLLISGPVFAWIGVEPSSDTVYASCVPLQQVGRILADRKEMTDDEWKLVKSVLDTEAVLNNYDPACADPMKDAVWNASFLSEHKADYLKLWFRLGMRYPMTYYRAYRDLMRMYYDPDVSSEVSYRWIYPNSFGVYRDSKLLPDLDFAYYEAVLEFPVISLLRRPGALLWSFMILWSICILRRKKEPLAFLVPFLAVYLGLFLTAPVALFRYVYSCFAAAPFLYLFPFLHGHGEDTDDEGLEKIGRVEGMADHETL